MALCCHSAAAAPVVTLPFMVPSGATAESSRLYLSLMREFEQREPGIRIEFQPLSSWDGVVTAVARLRAEGRSAGVFVAEVSETLELERLGLITPFEQVSKRYGAGLKDFLAPLTVEFLGNSYCADHQFCAPPFVRSMPVALYNLDKLEEVGRGKDQLPASWDALEALLEQLHQKSAQAPFCFGGEWYDYLFEATVLQAGGTLSDGSGRVTLDTPEAARALAFWQRLSARHLLFRPKTWKATLNAFTSGSYCAVTYYSSGGMQTVRDKSAFAWMADLLPRDKYYGVAVGGGNLYLSAGMSEQESRAAYKLAVFLYQPSVQARISAATGFFPVVRAAFDEPVLRQRYASEEAFVRVRQQLRYARPKLMAADNLKVREILKRAIDRALEQGMDPARSLHQAQMEVERLLKR